MAEYNERTGVVKWQRVVLASQRDQIEKWLGENYPVEAKSRPDPRSRSSVPSDLAVARSPAQRRAGERSS
jgi:hypothetical protein